MVNMFHHKIIVSVPISLVVSMEIIVFIFIRHADLKKNVLGLTVHMLIHLEVNHSIFRKF